MMVEKKRASLPDLLSFFPFSFLFLLMVVFLLSFMFYLVFLGFSQRQVCMNLLISIDCYFISYLC